MSPPPPKDCAIRRILALLLGCGLRRSHPARAIQWRKEDGNSATSTERVQRGAMVQSKASRKAMAILAAGVPGSALRPYRRPTRKDVGTGAARRALTGDIGSAGGGTGLFPSTPSLDQNEHRQPAGIISKPFPTRQNLFPDNRR